MVLIVGAGPAGLFAACELVRHGIRPRVVARLRLSCSPCLADLYAATAEMTARGDLTV